MLKVTPATVIGIDGALIATGSGQRGHKT
jgi:hypothetical protein